MTDPSASAAPTPARRRVRPLEVVGAALCLAAAVLFAASVVSQRLAVPAPTGEPWTRGTVITPAPSKPGVVLLPSPSRLLIVDSTPDGAQVRLGGEAVGETPLSQDWSCTPGEVVPLEVRRSGFKPARYRLTCADGTTRVQAALTGR